METRSIAQMESDLATRELLHKVGQRDVDAERELRFLVFAWLEKRFADVPHRDRVDLIFSVQQSWPTIREYIWNGRIRSGSDFFTHIYDLLAPLITGVAISSVAELDIGELKREQERARITKELQERHLDMDDEEPLLRVARSEEVPYRPSTIGWSFDVWFGTNRVWQVDSFGAKRADHATLGRVSVWIPKGHRFGEVGSSLLRKLARWDLSDDRLVVDRITPLDRDTFWSGVGAHSDKVRKSVGQTHALIFIHGYNVSFESAAIRAAQIGFDLDVIGPTAFFSWPSQARIAGYAADEASIEASEDAIRAFLVEFASGSAADKVHIVAHSMGNRGLVRALQRIASDASAQSKVRFGQIFLAAPDIDRDLFLGLAHLYPKFGERTTLYASSSDKAVWLSQALHSAPRAGYFEPYTVAAGIDTIAVPDFDVDILGHSYFAQAEALLHDMFTSMRSSLPPSARQRLISRLVDGQIIWELRR